MLVNAVLARRYECDNIFIGGQNGIRGESFNAVLTLDAPILANAIAMTLPLSQMLSRKHAQLFSQICSHCPELANFS